MSESSSNTGPVVRDGYLLFWSGWPSNWHPSSFTLSGRSFNCVEQWMMWSKARYFGDDEVAEKVLAQANPRRQKELGRSVRHFDGVAWSEVSRAIVFRGAREKFRQNATSCRAAALSATDHRRGQPSRHDLGNWPGRRSP